MCSSILKSNTANAKERKHSDRYTPPSPVPRAVMHGKNNQATAVPGSVPVRLWLVQQSPDGFATCSPAPTFLLPPVAASGAGAYRYFCNYASRCARSALGPPESSLNIHSGIRITLCSGGPKESGK